MRTLLPLLLIACAQEESVQDTAADLAGREAQPGDPYADQVVSFALGDNAGFGEADLPGIVLGPPRGRGTDAGSLDVVSLGLGGEIVLEMSDPGIVDGAGPDLLVFENPFVGFIEPGEVSVSPDGVTWWTFPCSREAPYTGCAGLNPVLANPTQNSIDPTDPESAGGDAFDLADLGVAEVRFVRITDIGQGSYAGNTGGFDLDALAVSSR